MNSFNYSDPGQAPNFCYEQQQKEMVVLKCLFKVV